MKQKIVASGTILLLSTLLLAGCSQAKANLPVVVAQAAPVLLRLAV